MMNIMAILNSISDSVVLITGGSKGIGFATATEALRSGASKVVIVARQSSDLENATNELIGMAKTPDQVVAIVADLSQVDGPAVVLDALSQQGIKVDFFINNAGFTKPATIFEATFSDFQTTINVNLYAPFLLIQGLLKQSHPLNTIVNIASTAGIKGRAGWATYSASKAALIAFSESLKEDLSASGINVVCLSPGRCATDLRKILAPDENPLDIMQPSQVAKIIMVYLSDLGRLIDSDNTVVRF